MTEILLIRHGETEWNAEKRLQGHLDIPLNPQGQQQAQALADFLSEQTLAAVYASDLQRARQTAQAIASEQDLPLHIEIGLRERCFGAFEGMLYSEIGERFPEAHAAWQARELDARFPPGVHVAETLREFYARSLGAVTTIANQHPGARIAIVSHGGLLDCIYRAATGKDMHAPRDFDILNASLNHLRWDGTQLHLLKWGSVEHLKMAARDELLQ